MSDSVAFEHEFGVPKCGKCGQPFTRPGFCGGCDVGSASAPQFTLYSQVGGAAVQTLKVNASLPTYADNRFLLVCAGKIEQLDEGATLDDAQSEAEEFAHNWNADVYILKPVRKVSPVRNVETTEL